MRTGVAAMLVETCHGLARTHTHAQRAAGNGLPCNVPLCTGAHTCVITHLRLLRVVRRLLTE